MNVTEQGVEKLSENESQRDDRLPVNQHFVRLPAESQEGPYIQGGVLSTFELTNFPSRTSAEALYSTLSSPNRRMSLFRGHWEGPEKIILGR